MNIQHLALRPPGKQPEIQNVKKKTQAQKSLWSQPGEEQREIKAEGEERGMKGGERRVCQISCHSKQKEGGEGGRERGRDKP